MALRSTSLLPPRSPTMDTPVPIQPSLFGGPSEILGLHVVAAHTRILEDGTEVTVAEHVRWNRGKRAPSKRPRRQASSRQASLFGPFVGAQQLGLFTDR